MRIVLVGVSAALLAGCNVAPVVNNSAGNVLMPGNAAAPMAPAFPGAPGNMMLPEESGAPAGNGMAPTPMSQAQRTEMIGQCTAEMRRDTPAAINVQDLCNCAVDSIASGVSQQEAVRQCAQRQGVAFQQ